MARALALIQVKLGDLNVLWCTNHIEYVPLEHIFWLQSVSLFILISTVDVFFYCLWVLHIGFEPLGPRCNWAWFELTIIKQVVCCEACGPVQVWGHYANGYGLELKPRPIRVDGGPHVLFTYLKLAHAHSKPIPTPSQPFCFQFA